MTQSTLDQQHTRGNPAAEASRHRLAWGDLGQRYGLVILLVAVTCTFALHPETSSNFLSLNNIRALIGNQAVTAILALAAILPLVAGEFDVSIGATLGLSAVVSARLLTEHETGILLAVLVSLAVGALVGSIIGGLVAYLEVSSFVISLGMATLLGGVVIWYSQGATIVGVPQELLDFGNQNWVGVPRPVWLLAVIAIALGYLLRYTILGRSLLAIGINRRAAQLVGINTRHRVALTFVLSGSLAALAGVVQLARTGSATAQVGTGFTLAALAAAFLGATTITPGRFNVPGTIIGVLFVGVAVNGLTLMEAYDWVEPVFNGAAVIIAVSSAAWLARRRSASA